MNIHHTDIELMKIQVEALFTQDENGSLRHINEPWDGMKPAPRFFFGYTNEGSICKFRHDLPDNVVAQLKEIAAEPVSMNSHKIPKYHRQFEDILQSHAPIDRVGVGPAYRFSEHITPPTNVIRLSREDAGLLKGDLADIGPELNSAHLCLAIIEDSQVVSICRSVRISARAHEAGVETLAGYRRRGYAMSVIAAWALAIRALNLIPLYSTSWDNVASQGVARRLGLVQYGVDYHVT